MIAQAGAAFVNTSTGFNKGGATVEDVALLSAEAKKLGLRVKAAGGIRDYATAKAMLEAGAERLGCSAGVKLVQDEKSAHSGTDGVKMQAESVKADQEARA